MRQRICNIHLVCTTPLGVRGELQLKASSSTDHELLPRKVGEALVRAGG